MLSRKLHKRRYCTGLKVLEELAGWIGVPKENLVASVNEYNKYVETGVDDLTGRKLLVATIDEDLSLLQNVYHLLTTLWGVEIDSETHVIYKDGSIVEGLYAAGEVTGGIHGGTALAEMQLMILLYLEELQDIMLQIRSKKK